MTYTPPTLRRIRPAEAFQKLADELRAVKAAHDANVKMHGEAQAYYAKMREAEAQLCEECGAQAGHQSSCSRATPPTTIEDESGMTTERCWCGLPLGHALDPGNADFARALAPETPDAPLEAVREHLACDDDCTGDHWKTWEAIESLVASLQAELTELREERDEAIRQRNEIRAKQPKLAELRAERDRLREALDIANDALGVLGECDTDNVHVEVWCINHQEKRCQVPEIRARFAALATPTEDERCPSCGLKVRIPASEGSHGCSDPWHGGSGDAGDPR